MPPRRGVKRLDLMGGQATLPAVAVLPRKEEIHWTHGRRRPFSLAGDMHPPPFCSWRRRKPPGSVWRRGRARRHPVVGWLSLSRAVVRLGPLVDWPGKRGQLLPVGGVLEERPCGARARGDSPIFGEQLLRKAAIAPKGSMVLWWRGPLVWRNLEEGREGGSPPCWLGVIHTRGGTRSSLTPPSVSSRPSNSPKQNKKEVT